MQIQNMVYPVVIIPHKENLLNYLQNHCVVKRVKSYLQLADQNWNRLKTY